MAIVSWFSLTDLSSVLLFMVLFAGFWLAIEGMGLRAYVRMARVDPVDVADVQAGMQGIALTGTARSAGGPVTAPGFGEETLVARTQVELYSPGRSGEPGGWGPIGDGTNVYEPFLLEDDTGKLSVDPNGASWNFEEKTRVVGGGEHPPAAIRAFLERNDSQDPVLSEPVFEHDRRFMEGRLDPGEDVYVLETAKAGPAEHVPADAVEPYVGTDRIEEGSGNVKSSLD